MYRKVKKPSKQVMYKAVLTNKMVMIWDVLAGHLTFLATMIHNLMNI